MLDSCMLYRHGMPLRWELLALLGYILAFDVASATHSLATRQPSYTSTRKIHTGRAVRAEHYSHSGKLLTPCKLQRVHGHESSWPLDLLFCTPQQQQPY